MAGDSITHQLNQLLAYLKERSPYYRERLAGVSPLSSAADIVALPVTTKQELSENTGSFTCVAKENITEIVSTSGSSGRPLYISLCREDRHRTQMIEAQNLTAAGFSSSDIVQLMVTSDRMFIAGQAYVMALSEISATVARMGSGNSLSQIGVCRDLQVNALVAVPSYLLKLAAMEPDSGWREQIEKIMLVGEPIYQINMSHNALGRQLTAAFPRAQLFSSYGSTEMQSSFCDCTAHTGMHTDRRFCHIEILDDNNNPLPPGEIGELTVTTLGIRCTPLLRYKTGDLTCILTTPCPCGNTSPRIGPILGRKDNRMKIKGTTFYPFGIIEVLHDTPGVKDFLLLAEQQNGIDALTILVNLHQGSSTERELSEKLNSLLKFTPIITQTDPETISALRSENACRKKLFFVDKR